MLTKLIHYNNFPKTSPKFTGVKKTEVSKDGGFLQLWLTRKTLYNNSILNVVLFSENFFFTVYYIMSALFKLKFKGVETLSNFIQNKNLLLNK